MGNGVVAGDHHRRRFADSCLTRPFIRPPSARFIGAFVCFVQVKIVKADIPEEYLGKVMLRTNEAMDKYQIEKVGSLYHPPTPHNFL